MNSLSNHGLKCAVLTSLLIPSALSAQRPKKAVKQPNVTSSQAYAQSVSDVDCSNVVERYPRVKALEPVVRALTSIDESIVTKDEFETSAAFEQRRAAHYAKLFGGSMRLVFVKKMDPIFYTLKYDADRGIMSIGRPFDRDVYHSERGRASTESSIQIFRETTKTERFAASNAYGASAEVERSSKVRSAFLFPSVQLRGLQGGDYEPFEVRMDTDQARRFKANPMMLVVAELRPPYLVQSFDRDKATIDYPYETRLTSYGLKVDLQCIVFSSGSEEIYRLTAQPAA